ncbi:hypothetical protein KIN20_013251 [Parelaphostrongylus tenuis]|uniref:Uncharacterized protein n=1 Tax=Parelaphostrongylus tenuis TaxID=148309 RepID=A0AAD5MD78_PARTN|nr:hypothetical protein KIN20_013251 [Parelaphostrongylus tenuis]
MSHQRKKELENLNQLKTYFCISFGDELSSFLLQQTTLFLIFVTNLNRVTHMTSYTITHCTSGRCCCPTQALTHHFTLQSRLAAFRRTKLEHDRTSTELSSHAQSDYHHLRSVIQHLHMVNFKDYSHLEMIDESERER